MDDKNDTPTRKPELSTDRRQFWRAAFSEEVRFRQHGKLVEATGIDLSEGGISFLSNSEPDQMAPLEVIILHGAIAIPGALRWTERTGSEGYRVSVTFDALQPEVFTVLGEGN